MPEKNHDLRQQGPHKSFGNDHVFYCSLPASKSWLGWCRKSQRDRLGWFCDTYCAVILWSLFCVTCSIPVTFCGAAVLKVKDQETLVSHYWSYRVRITVETSTLGEFARHELTNLWWETICHTLFLSLWGNKTQSPNKRDEWING